MAQEHMPRTIAESVGDDLGNFRRSLADAQGGTSDHPSHGGSDA
jgi:hypothetical protein